MTLRVKETALKSMIHRIPPWLRHVVLCLLCIGLYDALARWPFPYRIFTLNNALFEYPIVIGVVLLFYFPSLAARGLMVATAVATVIGPFLWFDVFYWFLGRAPRPSDLLNVHLVAEFSIKIPLSAVLVAGVVAVLNLTLILRVLKRYDRRRAIKSIAMRLGAIGVAVFAISSGQLTQWARLSFERTTWSEAMTVRQNGRIACYLILGEQESLARKTLSNIPLSGANAFDEIFPEAPRERPNIFIIVLESFIDPRMVLGVRCTPSPVAPELRPFLLDNTRFSKVISPVIGGDTAQVEFELLAGVRAERRFRSIDFNSLQGESTDGFIHRLKRSGYQTLGTLASNSTYFNVRRAYRSLGIDEPVFLAEENVTPKMSASVVFDGDLFEYGLERIPFDGEKTNRPTLSYLVGLYGHYPYHRNLDARPDAIATNSSDPRIHRIANQFYHRTRALGKFLEELTTRDPEAIIYVTSDHVPPIYGRNVQFVDTLRTNLALLLVAGTPVDVSGSRYFEIPWRIWDLICESPRTSAPSDAVLTRAYWQIIAESTSPGS